MGLMDILNGFTGADPERHFDQVAQEASPDELGSGIAAAMRSDQTPPFGDMVGQLFGHSNPNQQAGVLNQILSSVGPSLLSGAAGGILGRILRPGQQQVSPDQAGQLSPAQVSEIATHAERTQPGVVDQVSGFYAQHAGLIKMLGGAALGIAMAHMRSNAASR